MDNILYKEALGILGAGHNQILKHLLITPVENVKQYNVVHIRVVPFYWENSHKLSVE